MLRKGLSPVALSVAAVAHTRVDARTIDGLWRSPPRESSAWNRLRGEHALRRLERQPEGSRAERRIIPPIEGTAHRSRLRLAGSDILDVGGCVLGGTICEDLQWTTMP